MPWIFPRHFFKNKMKNIILTLVFSAFVVMILISSSGAPIGTTGAHGELTCGKVGCHTGVNQSENINKLLDETIVNKIFVSSLRFNSSPIVLYNSVN